MNLIEDNYKLVSSIARRYIGKGLEYDDLYQSGCIGLMEASTKFEPERGYKFSTYATYWIKLEILKALDNSHLIRKPDHINKDIRKMAQATRYLVQEYGCEPSPTVLAEKMGIEESKVRHLLKIAQPITSTEDLIVEDKTDLIGELDNKMLSDLLEKGINELDDREQKIIRMRFEEEKTLDEIGDEFNVSKQMVFKLMGKILKKLQAEELKVYL